MPYPGNNLIILGEYLACFKRADEFTPAALNGMVEKFCELLTACDYPNTAHAAASLKNLQNLSVIAVTGRIGPNSAAHIHSRAAVVESMMYEEAKKKSYIALDPSAISSHLRLFRSNVSLTPAQEAMIDETIRCMETGSCRTAFVMAWSSFYDVIRQWVFDNRLADFNDAIKHKYLHKLRGIHEITNYSDFWEHTVLGEWDVLDACSIAQSGPIISGKSFDRLNGFLRDRNDHAHPNFRVPTAAKVNAYVENLLDALADAPFKIVVSS
jgi:hypothetical protein